MRESLLYNKLLDQSSFTEVKSLKQFLKEREGQTFDTLHRFAEDSYVTHNDPLGPTFGPSKFPYEITDHYLLISI